MAKDKVLKKRVNRGIRRVKSCEDDFERRNDLSLEEYKKRRELFKNESGDICCAYCNESIDGKNKKKDGSLEHVKPINAGGGTTYSNIIPSCIECNNEKDNLGLNKWYTPENEKYTEERYMKIVEVLNMTSRIFSYDEMLEIEEKTKKVEEEFIFDKNDIITEKDIKVLNALIEELEEDESIYENEL